MQQAYLQSNAGCYRMARALPPYLYKYCGQNLWSHGAANSSSKFK